MGRPMSILDLYQHGLCGHYGEDGPEQLAHYSFIEQLNGTSTKDGKSKKIPSVSPLAFLMLLPLSYFRDMSSLLSFSARIITIY